MRLSNVFLGLAMCGVGIFTVAAMGCSDSTGSGSGGGGGASSTASTGAGAPCAPKDAACTAVKSDCIALVDNAAGTTTTLRMAQLSMTKPSALTTGLVKNVVQNGVLPNLTKCNLDGGGTFSWLLQFDKTAGTLKTGGAKPTDDPFKGYSFINETIGGLAIAPVTVDSPVGSDGKFGADKGIDVTVPIFLDLMASAVVLLPLKQAKLAGTLSTDNNCIGKFNAEGLDPENNCASDADHPAFLDAATLDGYITLEDADTVEVSAIGQTLCVLLSGDAAKYGDGVKPISKCKRTGGKIDFVGDWCDATNVTGDCKDSMQLGATFSAQAVKAN